MKKITAALISLCMLMCSCSAPVQESSEAASHMQVTTGTSAASTSSQTSQTTAVTEPEPLPLPLTPEELMAAYEIDPERRDKFQEKVSKIDLPIIHVYTEDKQKILSRDEYVNCLVDLFNCEEDHIINAAEGEIKVRGNSTAFYGEAHDVERNQVPYRIKFSQKRNMLGLNDGAECRSWVLLKAPWNVMPDHIAFTLAEHLFEGRYYSSDSTFTYVYVNEKFAGLYLLCEQNQINKHRVALPEVPEGYTGTDIGYFVELDNYAEENPYYFTVDYCGETLTDLEGTTRALVPAEYTVKNDVYSQEQVDHISAYISNVYKIMVEAIKYGRYYTFDENYRLISAEGLYDNAYDTINAVVDLDSAVLMYILYELTHDYDCGEGSFFMAVDHSGESSFDRLTFTAPWDFNWAYNDSIKKYYAAAFNDESFVAQYGDRSNPWFILLMSTDWFTEMVKSKWQQLYAAGEITAAIDECEETMNTYAEDLEIDGVCYLDNIKSLIKWVRYRIRWLNMQWGAEE